MASRPHRSPKLRPELGHRLPPLPRPPLKVRVLEQLVPVGIDQTATELPGRELVVEPVPVLLIAAPHAERHPPHAGKSARRAGVQTGNETGNETGNPGSTAPPPPPEMSTSHAESSAHQTNPGIPDQIRDHAGHDDVPTDSPAQDREGL